MKFTLLEDSGPKASWLVEDASPALLNALRRAVIAELDAFAIDSVEFFENSSPMFNEYVANRVGLVPLTFDDSLDPNAQVIFTLDAEAVDAPRVVYSSELKSQDDAIHAYAEHVPLIKLDKGQVLRLQGTAVKGKAKTHAKFQSAVASYGNLCEFKTAEKCGKCGAEIRMRGLSKHTASKIKKAPDACGLCIKCADARKDAAKEDRNWVFFVESFNNLPAVRQLERAVQVLEDDLKVFENEG